MNCLAKLSRTFIKNLLTRTADWPVYDRMLLLVLDLSLNFCSGAAQIPNTQKEYRLAAAAGLRYTHNSKKNVFKETQNSMELVIRRNEMGFGSGTDLIDSQFSIKIFEINKLI